MPQNQPLVLACIDGSAISHAVCDYAVWIAQRVNVPLKLLHNIEHEQTPTTADLSGNIGLGSQEQLLDELIQLEQQRSKLLVQKGKAILEAAAQRVQQAGIVAPIKAKRHGAISETLIELEDNTRVLVLGVRGEQHEQQKEKVGTHLEMIIRALHRPILVVNAEFTEPKTIMLAYDGSDAAEKAVDMVATSPLYNGLACHLVCVNNKAEQLLEKAYRKLKGTNNLNLTRVALTGKAESALCDYQSQHNIDLTIMGAFSHTRLRELLLGSFTIKMLLKTKKPLLLLR